MTNLNEATTEQLEEALAVRNSLLEGKLAVAKLATPLPMHEKHIFKVDVYDLDKYIKEAFGVNVEFIAVEEWCNDSDHEFAGMNGNINKTENALVEEVLFNGASPYHMFNTSYLLEYLVKEEMIPAGDYIINVCW